MRPFLPSLVLPLVLMAQPGAEDNRRRPTSGSGVASSHGFGAIEGRVINAVTGEAVRQAQLILRRTDDSASITPFPVSYSAFSDERGRFVINRTEPGRYRLWANRTGFV